MKKILLFLFALCGAISLSAQTEVTFDFDNNATALFGIEGRSSGSGASAVNDGDILTPATATLDGVSLTVSAKTSGNNENRLWASKPVLRMYSGTLTVSAPGHNVTQMKFTASKWGADNAFDSGNYNAYTWTADAEVSTVVLTVAANTRINSLVVTLDGEISGGPVEVVIEGTGEGTVESPYDVTRANSLIENGKMSNSNVYIAGKIKEFTDPINLEYGNATYVITDGTKDLLVYRGKGYKGENFTAEDEIKVDDEVVVCGKLVNYNGTYEVATGSSIYSINGVVAPEEPPYEAVGNGTGTNPYTVADVAGLKVESSTEKVWVRGFIIGNAASATTLNEGEKISDTNLALGATADAKTFIPVELPAGDVRTALGLATNPTLVGREVLLYGTLEKYFSTYGLKKVTEYILLGDEPDTPSEGELLTSVNFCGNTFEALTAEGWEYVELNAEGSEAEAGTFLTLDENGFTFNGQKSGSIVEGCAAIISPEYDFTNYTDVYVEYDEACSNFCDEEGVAFDAYLAFYYYTEGYEDLDLMFPDYERSWNNGELVTCHVDFPNDYDGERNNVCASFEYYSTPAGNEEYPEDSGTWVVKNFRIYGTTSTGIIERIEPIKEGERQIFDLTGRRIQKLQKGVNIVNGKKILR